MDLAEYAHTQDELIEEVVTYFLQGFSEEEIHIKLKGEYPDKLIRNIIDCYNYLNN